MRQANAVRIVAILVVALVGGAIPSPVLSVSSTAAPVTVTDLGAYRFQGWGTSLSWWANVVGGWSTREGIDRDLFGLPDAQHGDRLGLNVARYNIGASPVHWCAQGPEPTCSAVPSAGAGLPVADASRLPSACPSFGSGKAVPALADRPGASPDLGRDRNQVAVLKDAATDQPRGSLALEAFANSPPWWLTVSGCPQGNPDPNDPVDNLAPGRYGAYAEYLSQVLLALRREGLLVDSVDPLNEPENPWGQRDNPYTHQPFCTSACQEGLHFGPELPLVHTSNVGQLLAQVCDHLRSQGLRTKVSLPDGFNPSDSETILEEAGPLPSCVRQINTHMYAFVPPNGLVPYGQGVSIHDPQGLRHDRKSLNARARALSAGLWMSEFGTGEPIAGMASALAYSSTIAADLRWLRPTAWVGWDVVGGSGGWGLLEAPTWPREGPVTKTKRFYALEQYSRFIRPGYQVLAAADPLDDPVKETSLTTVAVDDLKHPRRVVVVGVNPGSSNRNVTYDVGRLGIGPASTLTRYRTAAGLDARRLDSKRLGKATLSDDQPPGSITTYVVER